MKHHCHWPGCTIETPASLHMCKSHWYTLPKHLRDLIWRYYVPGQEIRKDPTPEYMEAFKLTHEFAIEYERDKLAKSLFVKIFNDDGTLK
jgi:hypothetical protein